MFRLMNVADCIAEARQHDGTPALLPWTSFNNFFASRAGDARLADRPCLIYYDDERELRREYSYAEFGAAVRRMAAYFQHCAGLKRGDHLATVLFNHDVTVIVYFAAWLSGLTVVPINAEETASRTAFILEHSESSVVCCWEDRFDQLMSLSSELPQLRAIITLNDSGLFQCTNLRQTSSLEPRRSEPCPATGNLGDAALIVYTSGTTGAPKGVTLTVENLLIDADGIAGWHGFGAHDRLMCVLPIHHVNGIVVTLITPFYCKGSIVLNRKFRSSAFWRRLHDEQVTCVSVVPTLLEFLMDANEDLSPYRLDRFQGFICGAGPLLKETAARFEDRFPFRIRHGYGLSETTCYSCFLPNGLPMEEHRHWLRAFEFPSIGVPLRHNRMSILDESGRPLPELSRGEICIKGLTVCAGYFKRNDANEAAFRWGWFRSGDEGFYQRDGAGRPFFFVSGRLKELIIRGGVNISPLEIDDVLKSHPSVRFAMAVSFEHRYYGEEIAAYVVPREGVASPSPADLLAHCRRTLPFWKSPKVIVTGQDIPYTATGKPKRLELKARLALELAPYRDRQFREEPRDIATDSGNC
jgi:long-chain acyl-CoA synthetase